MFVVDEEEEEEGSASASSSAACCCGMVEEEEEVGISRELRRKMVFRRTEIAGSWSATRSLVQPSASGESRTFTAGELCFKRPDKVYIAFARMDTDEEGDGSKKERRVGSG